MRIEQPTLGGREANASRRTVGCVSECRTDGDVDRTSNDSFPASDAPGWTPVTGIGRSTPAADPHETEGHLH